MAHLHTIAKQRFRRLYYVGTALLVVLTVGSFMIPAYLGIRSELSTKIDQLSLSIIDQKRVFLEAVIVEKIGDIERIRVRLESQNPPLNEGEFDRRFRAEVREMIHATELPDNGYIWINEIVDYDGGDNYALRFAHPNLPDTEGDYLSTNTTDIVGNFPYREELEGIRENGEIYFDYYFKKKGSEKIAHKLSFAKLYEPYNWVVATGVYLDDVDVLVQAETEKMIASTNRTLRNGAIAIVVGTSVLLIMTVIFETRIRRLIDSYVESERAIGAQLLQEKSKLEASNRQKDRLFSIISHDLRGPIHALSAGIRMLEESDNQNRDALETTVITELGVSATVVASLVENLLEWSRSQQRSATFSPKELDLFRVVDGTCQLLAAMANQKKIQIRNLVERGTAVYADERMLETIVRNLIGNAIKFTPEGGLITIRSELLDNAVKVSVTDTGVGIEERVRNKLFAIDSGYRTQGTDGEKGNGLGLDLCKEFVQRHDGRLEVESSVGEGSTFSFTLPLPKAESFLT